MKTTLYFYRTRFLLRQLNMLTCAIWSQNDHGLGQIFLVIYPQTNSFNFSSAFFPATPTFLVQKQLLRGNHYKTRQYRGSKNTSKLLDFLAPTVPGSLVLKNGHLNLRFIFNYFKCSHAFLTRKCIMVNV